MDTTFLDNLCGDGKKADEMIPDRLKEQYPGASLAAYFVETDCKPIVAHAVANRLTAGQVVCGIRVGIVRSHAVIRVAMEGSKPDEYSERCVRETLHPDFYRFVSDLMARQAATTSMARLTPSECLANYPNAMDAVMLHEGVGTFEPTRTDVDELWQAIVGSGKDAADILTVLRKRAAQSQAAVVFPLLKDVVRQMQHADFARYVGEKLTKLRGGK